jgi:5-methylcytosine-specific restriction endonuclease McrA
VDRLTVAERDGWMCQICGHPIDPAVTYRDPETGKCNPGYLHIDHIYPLSKGGDHTYANAQASHAVCNKRKAAKID